MENSKTTLGHGTLSKTLGILENIWKKDKSIFNWPKNLLTEEAEEAAEAEEAEEAEVQAVESSKSKSRSDGGDMNVGTKRKRPAETSAASAVRIGSRVLNQTICCQWHYPIECRVFDLQMQ